METFKRGEWSFLYIFRYIDISGKKEYNYEYEEGRIIRAAESAITLSGEIVTGKSLVNSILYTYDSEGKLTKKRIIPVNGTEQVVYYENSDNNTVVKFSVGGRTIPYEYDKEKRITKVTDSVDGTA